MLDVRPGGGVSGRAHPRGPLRACGEAGGLPGGHPDDSGGRSVLPRPLLRVLRRGGGSLEVARLPGAALRRGCPTGGLPGFRSRNPPRARTREPSMTKDSIDAKSLRNMLEDGEGVTS